MIFVARHGESEANVRHVFDNGVAGLTLIPRGREQAAAMATELARYAPACVYTSPVRRARETAPWTATDAPALAEFLTWVC
jgi:broad specificity phosphatase PhoE